ncbi:hypothetical protein AgCh_019747 [Apium graveolens]
MVMMRLHFSLFLFVIGAIVGFDGIDTTAVGEVMKEADVFNKQMDALIAFRIKVDNPKHVVLESQVEMSRLAAAVEASSEATVLTASTSTAMRASDVYKLNILNVRQELKYMNMLAFSKILKKYDKITSRNDSKSYLKMV